MIVKLWSDWTDWLLHQIWTKVNIICVFVYVSGLWKSYYQVDKIKAVKRVPVGVFFCIRCVGNTSGVTAHVGRMTVALPTLQTVLWLTPTTTQSPCVWTTLRAAARGRSASTFILRLTCRQRSKPPNTKSTRLRLLPLWLVSVHKTQGKTQVKAHLLYHSNQSCDPRGAVLN